MGSTLSFVLGGDYGWLEDDFGHGILVLAKEWRLLSIQVKSCVYCLKDYFLLTVVLVYRKPLENTC